MFCRLTFFHFVVPSLVSSSDDSVNLLQTTVHKHVTSEHVTEAKAKCVVKGDPHVKMWSQSDADGAKLGLYGTYADYWLVNTDQLKVMGRIGGVDYAGEMGVVKGTALTGSLIDNKVLIIPTTNNGDVTLDGVAITDFPFESATFNMTLGVTENFQSWGRPNGGEDRDNSFTITMGSKAEIKINQDVFQHLQILVDESIVADDQGLCKVMCKNWFNCQDPICDLNDSLFVTEHDQCGEEILRTKCNKLRLKLAKEDCGQLFANVASDKPAHIVGMGIQNCIEDCCQDRNQCPDRDVDGTATCIAFGDPHVKGFDTATPDLHSYSPIGIHSLVHTEFFSIQANYATSPKIKAQISGIAFTGALVSDAGDDGKHSVLYFPNGGGVDVDGTKVMSCTDSESCSEVENFYSDPNGGHFNITYGTGDGIEELIQDRRPVAQRKNIYTVRFIEGPVFRIHIGTGQAIEMHIAARLLNGVSGECGNYNGNPLDDMHEEVDTAKTNCVSQGEIFIPGGSECEIIEVPGHMKCDKFKNQKKFKKQCMRHFAMKGSWKQKTDVEKELLKDCMKDCCLGGTCPGTEAGPSDDAF